MSVSTEYRQFVPKSTWLTARARNAVHRPVFIGVVSAGTFVTALVALVVMPQQAQRAASAIAPRADEWPDTVALTISADTARLRLAFADSALVVSRVRSAALSQPLPSDSATPANSKRDSVASSTATLNSLLGRVENSPLTASYRALAEAPALAGDNRVKVLLDSLADVDRQRDGLGALGGVDPAFVALTARATEIGRAIQAIGEQKRDSLRQALAALPQPVGKTSVATVASAATDTLERLSQRNAAKQAVDSTDAKLAAARVKTQQLERRADRARAIATSSAPPLALLGSALVFGLVLGFAAALVDEIRHPRIADAHEAERVAGVRVLSWIVPRPPAPERARRLADRIAPPYIDPRADGHQLVYLSVATTGTSLLMLTVTGGEPAITAVVATNFAAIAAEEAHNVLLVDADASTCSVAATLRIHAQPGLIDIIDQRVQWPEATVQTMIGRDRSIDVVPSGIGLPLPDDEEITELLRRNSSRLARHYDAIVIAAGVKLATSGLLAALPIRNVILCARVGYTRFSELRNTVDALRSSGGNPLGVVVWATDPPALLAPEELAAGRRPLRTAETAVPSAV